MCSQIALGGVESGGFNGEKEKVLTYLCFFFLVLILGKGYFLPAKRNPKNINLLFLVNRTNNVISECYFLKFLSIPFLSDFGTLQLFDQFLLYSCGFLIDDPKLRYFLKQIS